MPSIPEKVGEIFCEVAAFLGKLGIRPAGAPFAYWHGMTEESIQNYQALQSWIEENGYQAGEDMWETYLTNPDEVPDRSRWMTQIFWPVL